MIRINIDKKEFSDRVIFQDTHLVLKNGLYLLKGENGVGKTTLLNILYKLESEYSGKIYIDGINIKNIDTSELRTNYISYVRQSNTLFDHLTAKENIDLLSGDYDVELYKYLVEQFNVIKIMDSKKKVKRCSGGEKQKIKIVIGLLRKNPIIFLDEPDNNLDLEAVEFLGKYISETDQLVIITSHTFDEFLTGTPIILDVKNKNIFISPKQTEASQDGKQKDIGINKKEPIILSNKLNIGKKINKKLVRMNGKFRLFVYLVFSFFFSCEYLQCILFVHVFRRN